ncbi:hypothetical protein AB0I53_25165 [Saccharopolyspora sp. NPDC050389]|uniref:hypothetical protein n=1 Tax=Saccharopolyspora sp. NPDC050389 TaxID=3155516 RepID=UPI0033E06D0F
MSDLLNVPGEMEALAQSLESGAAALDEISTAPTANAGESIGIVADAVARLAGASAGVSGGLHQAAGEVRVAKHEYVRSDHTGADGMPQPPR